MLHKADGPVLFDLGGFCSRSITCFQWELENRLRGLLSWQRSASRLRVCSPYCLLISAQRSLCLLPRGFASCTENPISFKCALSVWKRLNFRREKSKNKRSWIHLAVVWALKLVAKAMRWRGCCLFTSNCQQWGIKLAPVLRNTLNSCFDVCSDCSYVLVWASWSDTYFQLWISWQVVVTHMQGGGVGPE